MDEKEVYHTACFIVRNIGYNEMWTSHYNDNKIKIDIMDLNSWVKIYIDKRWKRKLVYCGFGHELVFSSADICKPGLWMEYLKVLYGKAEIAAQKQMEEELKKQSKNKIAIDDRYIFGKIVK
jgi:hypothetical protein